MKRRLTCFREKMRKRCWESKAERGLIRARDIEGSIELFSRLAYVKGWWKVGVTLVNREKCSKSQAI